MASLSPRRQRILVVILMLLAAIALACWYFFWLEWEETEIDAGWSDAARRNPFLAAQQFLEQQGHEVRVLNSFSVFDDMAYADTPIGQQDLVILVDGYSALQGRREENLWQWLNAGGSLVLSTRNPFINLSEYVEDELLARLPLTLADAQAEPENTADAPALFQEARDSNCSHRQSRTVVTESGQRFEIAQLGGTAVVPEASLRLLWREPDAPHRMLRTRQGGGSLTINADNNLWRNHLIGCFDHAYALALLAQDREVIWFVLNSDAPSLWRLLWRAVPAFIVLVSLALLSWLWLVSRRVAPALAQPSRARRRFIEHLQGSASFLWRHQQQQLLVEQLRQDVLRQINRRHPGFARKSRSQKLDLVTQASGLSPEQIETALWRPVSPQPHEFTAVIRYLQYLSQQLGSATQSSSTRHGSKESQ